MDLRALIQPIDQFFAGSCDANGAFTSRPIIVAPTLYGALKVVAQVTGGAARWTIQVGGTAKAFPRGDQVDVPIVTQPNQGIIIQITSATPNAQVTGVITGIGGTTFQEAAPFVSLVPNAVTLSTLAQQQQIDSFTQAPNVVTVNKPYTVPAGTQSIRLQANENAQTVTFANLKIIGATTGIVYIPVSSATASTGGFDDWFKPAPPDVAGGILFSLDTTGSANGVEIIITADQGANFVEVNLVGNGTAAGSPILVENTTAAPWQAPNNTVVLNGSLVNPGASITILAAVPGSKYWLHWCEMSSNAAPAASNTWLIDDTTGFRLFANANTTQQDNNPWINKDFKGLAATSGAGIRLTNQTAGALNIYGSLDYILQ